MLRIRGHHLLCLHGFRGLGYSPEFVDNMRCILDQLQKSSQMKIEVLDSPDDICSKCPHLSDSRCQKDGRDIEVEIGAKDASVLGRLSLNPGTVVTSGELFDLTARIFSGGIEALCASCSWYELGWCEAGVKDGFSTQALA